MNYPTGFNPRELDIPTQDDLCPKCHEADMEVEYFWMLGQRMHETGDVVCNECGYRERAYAPFETVVH